VGKASDPSPPQNACKVFILFELGLDFLSWVIGKVLILLGFDVGDVGKVLISNKKSPGGKFPQGLLRLSLLF